MAATWYDAYWTALKAIIAQTWPEVAAHNLFESSQAGKRDWPNLLNSGQLVPPWVVVKVEPTPEPGWGLGNPRYSVAATISYMTADNTTGVDGSAVRIVPFILSRLIALQTALLSDASIPGTILTDMSVSSNADTPAESALLGADQRFSAGTLQFTTIVVTP